MPNTDKSLRYMFFAPLLFLLSCSTFSSALQDIPIEQDYFDDGKKLAIMQSRDLVELSGMTSSVAHPGMLWGHNDSGDRARVFLFDPVSGEIKHEVRLQDTQNIDFEDMTSMRVADENYLVIADIGDNAAKRKSLQLYRFKEPKSLDKTLLKIAKQNIEAMEIIYAEGPRDAETIMTTNDGQIVIITKREEENHIYLFDFEADKTRTLTSQGLVKIKNITAGDIRSEGAIALRTYDTIYYWPPAQGTVVERLIKGPDYQLKTLNEPQGEALAWDAEGGLYSVPEKVFTYDQSIHYYPKR